MGVQLPPSVTTCGTCYRENHMGACFKLLVGKGVCPRGRGVQKETWRGKEERAFQAKEQDVPRSGSGKEAGICEALKYGDLTRGLHWSGGFREVRAQEM